jgi:hypothetical protein
LFNKNNFSYQSNLSFKSKSNFILVQQLFITNLNINQKWIQNRITQAGRNGYGQGLNQLDNPHGVYIDDHQTIVVANY